MTTSNDPTEVKTSSGTPLPVLSQPQGELLTVNIDNIPLLKDAIVEGAHFQPLCLDMENNLWVVLANFDPGVVLPRLRERGRENVARDLHTKIRVAQGATAAEELAGGPLRTRIIPRPKRWSC